MAFIWVPFFPCSLSLRPGTIKNSRARLTKKRSKHKHTYAHIPRALFGLDHLLLLLLFLFSSPSLGIAVAVPLSCHKPSVGWCWFLTFASTRFQDFKYQVRLSITTIFTFHWIFFSLLKFSSLSLGGVNQHSLSTQSLARTWLVRGVHVHDFLLFTTCVCLSKLFYDLGWKTDFTSLLRRRPPYCHRAVLRSQAKHTLHDERSRRKETLCVK